MKPYLNVIILAAGKGKRLKSNLPKPLNTLAKKPLIFYILETVQQLKPDSIYIVKGYMGDILEYEVEQKFNHLNITWVQQNEFLGTAHAVALASKLTQDVGNTLILYGDTPLIQQNTLEDLIDLNTNATLSLLTCKINDPTGYGRILRTNGAVTSIVEEKDASIEEKAICEINTGIMVVKSDVLREKVKEINNNNTQQEYYLTDLIALLHHSTINSKLAPNEMEIAGVNTMEQLAELEIAYQQYRITQLMKNGVHLVDKRTVYIFGDLTCAKNVYIEPNVVLENTVIEENVTIGFGSYIKNTTLHKDAVIHPYSILDGATVKNSAIVGPFSRVRPGSTIQEAAHVGNFVEIKNSTIQHGSKVNHLSYIGDSTIGNNVNIGAGTITCNYDGKHKHQTIIEDDSFIGSNSTLVAPLHIGKQSWVAAGSTITTDVPEQTLAIARQSQHNKTNWEKKYD